MRRRLHTPAETKTTSGEQKKQAFEQKKLLMLQKKWPENKNNGMAVETRGVCHLVFRHKGCCVKLRFVTNSDVSDIDERQARVCILIYVKEFIEETSLRGAINLTVRASQNLQVELLRIRKMRHF